MMMAGKQLWEPGVVSAGGRHMRLSNECDAADRRKTYTGKDQVVELPAGVTVPGEISKGKRRYGPVDAVRTWLKENKR